MINGQVDLTKFPGIPDYALPTLQGMKPVPSKEAEGVSQYMGHDKGVPFRFFVHAEFNPIKSKAARYECFDEIEVIQWFNDQYNHPTEQVRFLPPELLSIDPDGGEVSGQYAEAYRNFKAGRAAPGTKLRAWGLLSEGQVATLEAAKIWSVEQLAAKEEKTFKAKFGKEFAEIFDRAVLFVNAKEGRVDSDKIANDLVASQKQIAQLMARIAALEGKEVTEAPEVLGTEKRRPGRPRKVAASVEE